MAEEEKNELSEEFESYSPASIPEIVESNDPDWQRAGGEAGVEPTAADVPTPNPSDVMLADEDAAPDSKARE
ncbi:MAG: hypothetical protein U0641_09325 [Anaerolineae bacterium]